MVPGIYSLTKIDHRCFLYCTLNGFGGFSDKSECLESREEDSRTITYCQRLSLRPSRWDTLAWKQNFTDKPSPVSSTFESTNDVWVCEVGEEFIEYIET